MARVTGVGKGPEFPPSGREPKISSVLAHNVGQTDTAARNAWLVYGFSELKGRCTLGPIDTASEKAAKLAGQG